MSRLVKIFKKKNSYINKHNNFLFEFALWKLVFLHIFIIAISNYLVQIPLIFFGIKATWGAITFPLIFLATDLTVRIYGAVTARKVILFSFIPALIISYLITPLFQNGKWLGFGSLLVANIFALRIVIASISAYLFGQVIDILVFNRLRKLKIWWIAPSASAVFGNALDTLVFFVIAFYKGSNEYLSNNLIEIGVVDYCFKLLFCMLLLLPLYNIFLSIILKKILINQK